MIIHIPIEGGNLILHSEMDYSHILITSITIWWLCVCVIFIFVVLLCAWCRPSRGCGWMDRGLVRHPQWGRPRESDAPAILSCCRGVEWDGTRKGNSPGRLRISRNRYYWLALWRWNTVGYRAARRSSVAPARLGGVCPGNSLPQKKSIWAVVMIRVYVQ